MDDENESTNEGLEKYADNKDTPNFLSISKLSEDEKKVFFKYTNCGIPLDQLFTIYTEIAAKDEATLINIIQSMA